MGEGPLLEARGLASGYGKSAVVRNVNLRVERGEVVAILGPNGAGKSTTLLALVGVLPTLDGEIKWHGSSRTPPLFKRARQGLAFVPEERSVLKSLSVRDNLKLGKGGVDLAVAEFPELVPLLKRQAGLLSGGEQQMLSLARALATSPSILIVDELSLGLAPQIVERLMASIKKAVADRNIGVLLIEQQARRALEVADRWYLMRQGSIVDEGLAQNGSSDLERAFLAKSVGEQVPTSAVTPESESKDVGQ